MNALEKVQHDIDRVEAEISAVKSQLDKLLEPDERQHLWKEVERLGKREEQLRAEKLLLLQPAGSRQPDPLYSELISRLPTPSSVARAPKEYSKFLKLAKDLGFPILGHRPDADAHGIPVALLSTTLGGFVETYRTCHPQERDCKDAIDLCKAAAQGHEDEEQLWRALKDIISSLLPVDRFTVTPSSVGVLEPDAVIMAGDYMMGQTELKTDAGGNSYGQCQAYYLSRVHDSMDPAVASNFQAHYCPILSLEINAASLRVCGLCYHDKQVFCQPLTPALHLFCLDDEHHMLQLAQCLAAVRKTFNALSILYFGAQPPLSSNTTPCHLRKEFPGATCAPLRRGSLAFHVILPEEKLVVKFVQIRRDSDPVAMHKLWEHAGYAPKLVKAVTLPAGFVALHMEYLSPEQGWHCLFHLAPAPGGPNQQQHPRLSLTEWIHAVVEVQKALAAAHAKTACTHGDARPNNVMVLLGPQMQIQKVYFVDLDWAGKAGARYPVVMNPDIRWSHGAGYGQVMEQRHDIDLLQRECDRLQPAVEESDMDLSV